MSAVAGHDMENSLAIRAAWLHYAGGLTQAAVAKKLGIANVKAHRLITRANQAGAVKVSIVGDIAECVALETEIAEAYGLDYCEVAPDLLEEGLPLRTLGMAGASFLKREIESRRNRVIGLGHGRTLLAAVNELPRMDAGETEFVSLLGGLTRNFAANPHDVMNRLADKMRAAAYVMPIPFVANSAEDREVFLAQRGVREVFELAARSDLKLVGIGTTELGASQVAARMIEPEEIEDVRSRGGVGELLGHFFDQNGSPVETALTKRTLSAGVRDGETTRMIAIGGGREKTGAIRSVLLSGCLQGLITDERTAIELVKREGP